MIACPVVVVFILGLCSALPPDAPSQAPSFPIAIVGDTQRTLVVERLVGREQNDEPRAQLSRTIARAAPRTLVHLGDLVSFGSSPREWRAYDAWVGPIQASGTRVYAVIGNHDTWGAPSLAQMARRFDGISTERYSRARAQDVELVFLDSNLKGQAWKQQRAWLDSSLSSLEADPSVRGVLVFAHHPPYTLGAGRVGDERVASELVPAVLRSTKVLAMFSGHVHGYERFDVGGRVFVVSGGGGGPRVQFDSSENVPPGVRCTFERGPAERPFHYLWLERRDDQVIAEARAVGSDQASAEPFDRFTLTLVGRRVDR